MQDLRAAVKGGVDPNGIGSSVVAADVLWSDPVAEPGLRANAARGVGLIFGPDITQVGQLDQLPSLRQSMQQGSHLASHPGAGILKLCLLGHRVDENAADNIAFTSGWRSCWRSKGAVSALAPSLSVQHNAGCRSFWRPTACA